MFAMVLSIPDHHLDGIYANPQALVLRDNVRNPAAAVADFGVKINPLPGWRLGHDMNVHLGGGKQSPELIMKSKHGQCRNGQLGP